MKFWNSNFIVLAAGSVIIAVFSALFYIDVNRRIDAGDAQVIGSITFKKRVAQRKYSRHAVWEDLAQTEPIYNNDTIRTGEKSEAVVRIKDGSEFTLNENSMVLVSMGGDQFNIEFNQGSLTANRDNVSGDGIQKLNIMTGGTTVTIDKSTVNVSKEKGQELSLVVNKGDALVKTGSMEKTVTVDQKAVVMLQSSTVQVEKQAIVLLSPGHDQYFISGGPAETVQFSWKPVEMEGDLFLEVIPGIPGRMKTVKKQVEGTSHPVSIAGGEYQWRVAVRDRKTNKYESSETRRFSVIQREPVNLVSPAPNALFHYRTKPQMINFKWSENRMASGYSLVIGLDREMKQVFRSFNTTEGTVSTDTLAGGTYYWKVTAESGISSAASAGESETRKLVIARIEEVNPPEPVYPPDGRRLSKKVLEKKNLEFSWRRNPEVVESEIEIARDAEFSNIYHREVKKPAFLMLRKDITPGTYFWRITGILEDRTRTRPSPHWTFSVIQGGVIELLAPSDREIVVPRDDDKSPGIRFSWRRMDVEGKFTIQVARDREFKALEIDKQVAGYFAEIPRLAQGNYYWRVFMVEEDGSILMKSPERALTVEDRLDAPVMISPANGRVVTMDSKNSLSFSWNAIAGADAYRLELYQVKNGREFRVLNRVLKGNTFDMTELHRLDESRFTWTLQALDIDRDRIVRKSPVAKAYFDITLVKKLEKPVIRVPKIIFAE
jgi:hypothetical protein